MLKPFYDSTLPEIRDCLDQVKDRLAEELPEDAQRFLLITWDGSNGVHLLRQDLGDRHVRELLKQVMAAVESGEFIEM